MRDNIQSQIDRIHRAAALIAIGAVKAVSVGVWSVASQSNANKSYRVTATTCTCRDSKSGHTCKHRWAAIGATVAVFLIEVEAAASLTELHNISFIYTQLLTDLPEVFSRTAWELYDRKQCDLTAQQPASSAEVISYNSRTIRHGRTLIVERQAAPTFVGGIEV